MADDEKTPWAPPYVSDAPASPEREEAPRGWKRYRGVVIAAAVLTVSAGVATVAGLVIGPTEDVTIVAAQPGAVVVVPSSAAPVVSPTTPPPARNVARVARSVAPTTAPATSRPAPSYTASPADLAKARTSVAKAEKEYSRLLAAPGTTKADLLIAQYKIEAARQALTDLKAGQPNAEHRYLRILRAKAYLAKAEELYRSVFADPAATEFDRKEAVATVLAWRDRLAEAKRSA